MSGVHQLLIKLLYRKGLRLTEGLSLRVKILILLKIKLPYTI